MHYIFERLTTWLAPIMCFTMEEVWQARNPSESHSVHMELYRDASEEWVNRDIEAIFIVIRSWRDDINASIEKFRAEGKLRSSLQAFVIMPYDMGSNFKPLMQKFEINLLNDYDDATDPKDTFADLMIVSEVDFNLVGNESLQICLLYTSPSPRDATLSRMPSSA